MENRLTKDKNTKYMNWSNLLLPTYFLGRHETKKQ